LAARRAVLSISPIAVAATPQAANRFCVQVVYPKRTEKPLYHGLVTQLESCNIPFLSAEDVLEGEPLAQRFDVVIDAIFGFSFKGAPRPPFDGILEVTPCKVRLESGMLSWAGRNVSIVQVPGNAPFQAVAHARVIKAEVLV
jgi:hypothetical protein